MALAALPLKKMSLVSIRYEAMVYHRANMDIVVKIKLPPLPQIKPQLSSLQPVNLLPKPLQSMGSSP